MKFIKAWRSSNIFSYSVKIGAGLLKIKNPFSMLQMQPGLSVHSNDVRFAFRVTKIHFSWIVSSITNADRSAKAGEGVRCAAWRSDFAKTFFDQGRWSSIPMESPSVHRKKNKYSPDLLIFIRQILSIGFSPYPINPHHTPLILISCDHLWFFPPSPLLLQALRILIAFLPLLPLGSNFTAVHREKNTGVCLKMGYTPNEIAI